MLHLLLLDKIPPSSSSSSMVRLQTLRGFSWILASLSQLRIKCPNSPSSLQVTERASFSLVLLFMFQNVQGDPYFCIPGELPSCPWLLLIGLELLMLLLFTGMGEH